MPRFNSSYPRWEITHRSSQHSICFPVGYDTSNLIEVSRVGEFWATFLNPETGEEIRCEDFHKEMMKEAALL